VVEWHCTAVGRQLVGVIWTNLKLPVTPWHHSPKYTTTTKNTHTRKNTHNIRTALGALAHLHLPPGELEDCKNECLGRREKKKEERIIFTAINILEGLLINYMGTSKLAVVPEHSTRRWTKRR
jgi:hypothetical protein